MAAQQPYPPLYHQPPQYPSLPASRHPYAYAQDQQQSPTSPIGQPYPTPTSSHSHSPYPYAQQYAQSQYASPNPSPRASFEQPVRTSPPRRPLPDPRMPMRRSVPHPLPATPAFDPRNGQQRFSGMSLTSEPPPSPRRLPQPQTIPRSAGMGDLVARSTSPTKGLADASTVSDGAFLSNDNGVETGQKFVPHWRRALPSPLQRRGTVSTSPPSALVRPLPSPALSHSRSNSVQQLHPTTPRPQLPPQPSTAHAAIFPVSAQVIPGPTTRALRPRGRTLPQPVAAPNYPPPSPMPPPAGPPPASPHPSMKTMSTGTSSDDEDIANHVLLQRNTTRVVTQDSERARPPSPQYGIRDLPMRRAKSDATTSYSSPPHPALQPRAPAVTQVPTQSATMRLAAQSLMSESSSPKVQPSSFRAPAPQPHLPPTPPKENGSAHPMPSMARGGSVPSVWPSGLPPLPRGPGSAQGASAPGMSSPGSSTEPPGMRNFPPRGQSLAWTQREGTSTPRAPRDIDLNLDDAPPPSLRRSPSPGRGTSPVCAPQTTHGLPNIRTALPTPPFSPAFSSRSSPSPSPNVATPTSAASAFTLSSFPVPPSYGVAPPGIFGGSTIGDKTKGAWTSDSKHIETSRTESPRSPIPKISFPANAADSEPDEDSGPVISISAPHDAPAVPSISISADDSPAPPQIMVSDGSALQMAVSAAPSKSADPADLRVIRKGSALACGGCGGTIVGRTVSAMGARWHPGCFKCCVCDELLENLSSYEHDGRAYCHLDYHERFAPKCYHCETAIVDERFITLDDHELGQRTYHEQHFFCAECGDPFLPPSQSSRSFAGDGSFGGEGDDDVGFTVYRGHPYCESCHVRLRNPKCKRCKRTIKDGARAVEALGGKWCWECFLCARCEKPFEDPSFFQRDGKPFCESCFSIMIKSEM